MKKRNTKRKGAKMGKVEMPTDESVKNFFAGLGGFAGGRLIRKKVTMKSNWMKKNPIVPSLLHTGAGLLGVANFKNIRWQMASCGFALDGMDGVFSTFKDAKGLEFLAGTKIGDLIYRNARSIAGDTGGAEQRAQQQQKVRVMVSG